MGLSLFDLLLAAAVLPLLDVLLLPLLLLLGVPHPASLLAGLLHGLELVLHVPLVRVLGHVAAGHGPTGPQQLLRGGGGKLFIESPPARSRTIMVNLMFN